MAHPLGAIEIARTEITLIGCPLEAGAGVRGSVMGPAAYRVAGLVEALRGLGHAVRDEGDIPTPRPVGGETALNRLAETCRNAREIAGWTRAIHDRGYALMKRGGVPVFLGGDHALSMGSVAAAARIAEERGQDLVVLWLDAHADFNTPATSPSGNMHGMALAYLTGEPTLAPVMEDITPVDPTNVHLFGLRSIDAQERQIVDERGVTVSDMRIIDEFGAAALMRDFLASLEADRTHLHVSLDVDFLDPSLAPGVGTTVPGGATYREAHLVMELLHESGLVASVDLVELNPFLDDRGKSARLMTELVASLFGRTILDRKPIRATP
ncbi:arginase [Salinarimonas ramus]|uniref:Arginase n=1 Tax=Salinarimonas ramus TaxID=690164 RepID=A0A917Q4Y6_9HYPH|nr:arginase [Salinarimonas ramus]GGK21478.1 arginase [Salinarimonas ramus]